MNFIRFAALACVALLPQGSWAQKIMLPAFPPAKARTQPVGLPLDAGKHDDAAIEWWYYNAFLKTESGKKYAVVASFFRTGLPNKKGHYLIYSLADLDAKTTKSYSILDKSNMDLLRAYLPIISAQRPNDPRPLQLLGLLQKGQLPPPHKPLGKPATLAEGARFGIAFGDENTLSQTDNAARNWQGKLAGDNWNLTLSLSQKETMPPMLVGGDGKTSLDKPDDMFYLSLTQMAATGTLTVDGKSETVTGTGWLDRQWGTSWVVRNNGWDWFGVHLDDGSSLIVYRVTDNNTHKTLRAEATLLTNDGVLKLEKKPVINGRKPWTDKKTGIVYPGIFDISLPSLGMSFTVTPAFPDQTIPVIGIGDAIWEGVVSLYGRRANGEALSGQGYMELVGYAMFPAKPAVKPAPVKPAK